MSDPAGDVRAEVRQWLAANWTPGMDRDRWADLVLDAGWSAPSWGAAVVGRGLSDAQSRVVAAEFNAVGRPEPATTAPTCSPAPCMTGHRRAEAPADPAVAARGQVVPALQRTGRRVRPGGPAHPRRPRRRPVHRQRPEGVDVVRGGGRLRVADRAHRLGVFPSTKGISFFMLPMRQPGVEVRPIHQITGESEFNEVFLTDAVVPRTTWSAHRGTAGACCRRHWGTSDG